MAINQNSNLKSQNQSLKVKTDLKERCYSYSINIIKFLTNIPEKRNQQIISNQLIRSATSIGANVIEAKSASSKRDFIKYLRNRVKIGE
jgi:four helix bundle protein